MAAAFNVATLVFALPLYESVGSSSGLLDLLRLVFLVQAVPTAGVFLAAQLLDRGPAPRLSQRLLWTGLILLATVALLRLSQIKFGLSGWYLLGQLEPGGLAVLLVAVAAVGMVGSRVLFRVFASLVPVFLLVSLYFVTQASISSINLASPNHSRDDTVFILIFDELGRDVLLQDGSIDGQKFPNIQKIASDGVWFNNSTTNYYWSCDSINSFMNGRFVTDDVLRFENSCRGTIDSSKFALLTALARQYRITVIGTRLSDCPRSSGYDCHDLSNFVANEPMAALIRFWIPDALARIWFDNPLGHFVRADRTAPFRELLAEITATKARGRVYFHHLLLPHEPYVYDYDGSRHGSPYVTFRDEAEYDALAYGNYQKQVMLVDSLLGAFVDRLKELGLYQEATIVITADHGPRGPLGFAGASYAAGIDRQTPNIPLLIRSPRLGPQVTEVDYQHVDFVPTLLDLLQVEPTGPMEGVSGLEARRPSRDKRILRGVHTYVYTAESGSWMLQSAP